MVTGNLNTVKVGNRLNIQFSFKLVNLDKKLEVVTSNLNNFKVGNFFMAEYSSTFGKYLSLIFFCGSI